MIGEKTTDEFVTIEIEGLAQADVVHIIGSESYQDIEIKDTTTFKWKKLLEQIYFKNRSEAIYRCDQST